MEVSIITFWFQLVRGKCACEQHTVNFFHLMRASVSAKQLKGQYFGHLMGRADSLEKALMLEKIEGRRRG